MIRKDREMSKEFGLNVIDESMFGTMSIIDEEGKPYSVPLSLVRDGENLYFHGAKQGKKIDCIRHSQDVHLVFVNYCKVPRVMTEEQIENATPRELGSKVFTMEFQSAEATGIIGEVVDKEEKMKALRLICEKYTPDLMKFFEKASVPSLDRTAIYKIEMKEITAKRKKFDKHGDEMKFGRME